MEYITCPYCGKLIPVWTGESEEEKKDDVLIVPSYIDLVLDEFGEYGT